MSGNAKLHDLLRSCEFVDGLATARLVYRAIGDVTEQQYAGRDTLLDAVVAA